MKIIGIIGTEVYTSIGEKLDAREFQNTPRSGDRVIVLADGQGYHSEHVGDSSDCVSGACPIK